MNSIRHKAPPVLLFTVLAFFSAQPYSDVMPTYNGDNKKDIDYPSKKTKLAPFDFSKQVDVVNSITQGQIEAVLGGNVDQDELESLGGFDAFERAFEDGDKLFEIKYNALDGVGANVGNGQRFTSIPRPDLRRGEAWAKIFPQRTTGPNGDSCLGCHNDPVADGAGGINDNTIRIDPKRRQRGFIERQTPHIFGLGAIQLLAEEMTVALQTQRTAATKQACIEDRPVILELETKGVRFGRIRVLCENTQTTQLQGIDEDLIVKPFEWKGLTAFIRDFVRGAAHQELGMQAEELVGNADKDFDDVTNELSVGDITALTMYVAGQQRPTTKLELNQIVDVLSDKELETFGLPLDDDEIASIQRGEIMFDDMRCSACHIPALVVDDPIFAEPSRNRAFRDDIFPVGEDVPLPGRAIFLNITRDIFVNEIPLPSGQSLGEFERSENGGAIVRLYGDLKRHNMGKEMAEEFDEGNIGASVFLTENLWGVGSTAPYMRDGRATTLTEAILYHGGDSQRSRQNFLDASDSEKADLIAFMENLVLFLEDR